MWGEEIPKADGNYKELALNDYRKFVTGFAFAFLKYLGFCPEWLKSDAIKHIREYENFAEREYPTWGHLTDMKIMNKKIVNCLENSPSQSLGS